MQVDPSISLRTLRAEYQAACTASNEIIADVGDADAPVTRNGKQHDLRWALLAVIERPPATLDTPTSSANRSTAQTGR